MFESIDPTTEEPFHRVELDAPETVERKLETGFEAWRRWRHRSFAERAEAVRALAASLRKDRERLAHLMVREMGKPVVEARGEVDKTAWCYEHYAEHAESYLAPVELGSDASRSYVQHLPQGPAFGILPWNDPLWLSSRVAAPALMAGNAVLLKHDPHVPACAEALAEHARETLPEGLQQFLFVEDETASAVVRDARVRSLSFTGSTEGGRAVASVAGSVSKPSVLELGGSDPAIVLADADLEAAAETLKSSRMINAGQSCIAAKRILVEHSVYDAFLEELTARIDALRTGDPGEEVTEIGPLARRELRDALADQVARSREAGARCLVGGAPAERRGWFYLPTLLADVPRDAAAFREETFGPLAAVTPVDDVEDALRVANDSPFGLAAGLWTDPERGRALAAELETGQVAVNGIVKTDPRLPSGGTKASGHGRELGPQGILEFVNAQQVWVGPARE